MAGSDPYQRFASVYDRIVEPMQAGARERSASYPHSRHGTYSMSVAGQPPAWFLTSMPAAE